MTDIAATIGLCGLESFDRHFSYRRKLFNYYKNKLTGISGIRFVDNDDEKYCHAAWLVTVLVENRDGLKRKLEENNIESARVHYRNDRYAIFSKFKNNNLENMNYIDEKYLVLTFHVKINTNDIDRIIDVIKSGW